MQSNQIRKFLSMDPVQFDQDENGWRSLVGNTSEEDIANLIIKYIKGSSDKIDAYNEGKFGNDVFPIDLLYFHAGQSFGFAGTKYYKDAIKCFRKSYNQESECWNAYVNGTIAFLEGDRDGIEKQISIIQNSKADNKRGGNIEILENYSKCLERGIKEYEKAYSIPL